MAAADTSGKKKNPDDTAAELPIAPVKRDAAMAMPYVKRQRADAANQFARFRRNGSGSGRFTPKSPRARG